MTLGEEQLVIEREKDPNVIARHRGRYHLVAFFCRPGMNVLDFPCGSGYGYEILKDQGIEYEGRDRDEQAIEYAFNRYGGNFRLGNLINSTATDQRYDIIACIEGLEHIDKEAQERLILEFYKALKPGGLLIISSPESTTGKSGPNPKNAFHKHELTRHDLVNLISCSPFISILSWFEQREILDDGLEHNCFYAICRK